MSKVKITGKVISIQLGRDETKLVLLGKDSQILFHTTVPTPMGAVEDGMIRDLEAVRGMLKTAVNIPELKRVRQVVFSLCTSQVITDTITTPDLSMAKIEKLIQANVDMYFPVDMKEYTLVWQPIGPAKKDNGLKEMAIQLWAVPIAMVTGYYTVANACGLSVLAIDYCGNSIATAVGATFSRPVKAAKEKKKLNLNAEITIGKKKKKAEEAEEAQAPEAVAYSPDTDLHITLERDLLGMTFVQGGQVVLQRFIQCGGDPAYQFGELSMMLEYYRSLEAGHNSFITGIVSGTLSQDIALISDLADMLGLPLTNLTVNYEPQLMLCLGASKTTEDFGIPDLNNPSKTRKHLETQLWQYALVLAGGVALIVVVMFTLSARLVWNANISSLESTQRSLQIQAQKYAGYADNYKAYSNLYDSYSADWDLVFNQLRTYNDNLVRVMQELEDTLPKNSSVIKLEIAPDGLNVQFACETKEEAAALIMDLRELKYADLVAISSLQGGGGGAATSYGSGEEAPTEGSNNMTSEDREKVIDCIVSTTDDTAVWELQIALTDAQAESIEMVYGCLPGTKYTSLDTLKADKNPTNPDRSDAIYEMFTTNHYCINNFLPMIEADLARSEPILTHLLMDDLMADENADILDSIISGNIESGAKAKEYNERLTKLLIKSEERISATEKLMTTDIAMERWNIYYLEVELGITRADKIPYLDMVEVVDDLAAGSFNTGDAALNAKMNELISDDVWSMLASLTGADQVPLPDDYTDAQLYAMVGEYYTKKTSGDRALDEMIKNYDSKGTSGNKSLDKAIKKYKDENTQQKPTEPGKDDSSLLDVYTDEEINQMMIDYLSKGTTGNMVVDILLQDYIETGTTGFDDVDKAIDEKVDDLVEKYSKSGTTGNKEVDNLILMVSRGESTGNAKLDKFINDRLKEAMKDAGLDDDTLGDLIESLLGGGKGNGGTGGGGGGQPQDTRIFFQATLKYNDELKAAELTRKGLFYDDKVAKVEVAE